MPTSRPTLERAGVHRRQVYQSDGNLGERVAVLETEMKHRATRAWVLGGVIGGILSGLLLILAILNYLGWRPT